LSFKRVREMNRSFMALCLCLVLLLSGCSGYDSIINLDEQSSTGSASKQPGESVTQPPTQGEVPDLGDDDTTFGEDIEDTGAYEGEFDTETDADVVVECISGTKNAYKLEGTTLTFTAVGEDSAYSISGTFSGNIIIDTGDGYKFDLEMHGFSLTCDTVNPITVLSGEEVAIKAKKDTKNYIYDKRAAIDDNDETLFSGAIHSEVDLEIAGKGELTVVSENNNGIHSKDDLQVKNLTLFVACMDNALKGNDSVEITGGNTTLIASVGDSIKTTNSDISDKGNQRGTITISGGTHELYAACDGIDAAYDVYIDNAETVLNIYTDKYSNYSKEVTSNSSDVNYIRFFSNKYYFSVKYYNSETDYVWVNAQYHSKVSGGRTNYYYYSYPKMENYAKQQFYIYELESQLGQEETYAVKSDYLTPNSGCDTFALSQSYNGLSYQWTNYTTKIQQSGFGGPGGGPGGMGDGNSEKGDHSTKGIKAANEIVINDGTVSIKSYDDAIHANNDTTLENGADPLGNVTVNGGTITVYSNDDGLHADNLLSISGGTVSVTSAYEGMEGAQVSISGGYVSINSKDDGINATTSSGTAVTVSGGTVYIYCTGDGIDSNSRTADVGIVFSGGRTVVISNSGMNSSIDTESGYTYSGGSVVAIMPRGGMSSEATHCDNFNSIGKSTQLSLTENSFLLVEIGQTAASIKMPVSLSATVIVLGSNSASVTTVTSTNLKLDNNGVHWS